MHDQADYHLSLVSTPDLALAEKVHDLAWRFDFNHPGFCLLDAGADLDSHVLRSWMVELKRLLSEVGVHQGRQPFAYRSMARFDQQETTKFHVEGAPDQSMLMLGYEPSRVQSRLFLADYSRAAFDMGLTPQQFLQDFNPMYQRGEALLSQYVTELPQPSEGHFRILLINNSSSPFTENPKNALGVMHKAEIVNPTETERRIVNSTMLIVGETEDVSWEQQIEFVNTERVSQKFY